MVNISTTKQKQKNTRARARARRGKIMKQTINQLGRANSQKQDTELKLLTKSELMNEASSIDGINKEIRVSER